MTAKIIAQGAEATIKSDKSTVVKHRLKKSYRHPEIDEKLRKARTKREAKVLKRLEELGFPAPRLLKVDDKSKEIHMQHIKGKMVKDILHEDHILYSKEIGKKVAELHVNDIIHGDLTTSNMIHEQEIKFIDFGLSQFSDKPEDKAVDLYLLKRALESKHHKIFDECFKTLIKEYKKHNPTANQVLTRLKKVELRGRYKHKH